VVSGHGINCESETALALELAGVTPTIIVLNELLAHPERLLDYPLLVFPGGFSFGDDVASGKILGLHCQLALKDTLQEFLSRDRLIMGICNGFQMLVKMGLLPDTALAQTSATVSTSTEVPDDHAVPVTLVHNRQRQFMNRWVWLKRNPTCWFFEDCPDRFEWPIRHGEGRLVVASDYRATFEAQKDRLKALSYELDINGSTDQIAALTNAEQTILGLMPHPEACVRWTQHPQWTDPTWLKQHQDTIPSGLQVFKTIAKRLSN
jgi:phosphoribosylformylglycinamidine synthase